MPRNLQDDVKREWRELGFFFAYDEEAKHWSVTASRLGLATFSNLLIQYAANPKHLRISEHEHFGPYMDLKLVTWSQPEIRVDGIYGRPEDFVTLSKDIDAVARSGATSARLGRAFVKGEPEIELEIHVAPDGFDPATADPSLAG